MRAVPLDSEPKRMASDYEARNPTQGKDPLEARVSGIKSGKRIKNPEHLWYIHGQAYDLKEWIKLHPGGPDLILNARGIDATALFESYHPFTDRARNILSKMKPVEVSPEVLATYCVDTTKGNFFYLPDGRRDPFWESLRERCGNVMREQKISRDMGWGHFLFLLFLFAAMGPMWWFGYCNGNGWISHGTAFAMGIVGWWLARAGHDTGHFAVAKGYWANRLGYFMGFFLSNHAYWELLHTMEHHSFTNMENDPDLYHYVMFLRDHPNYPWSFFHRFQVHRLWCYIVWSFTTAGLIYIEPLVMIFTGSGTVPATLRLHKFRFFFYFKMIAHMISFTVVMLGVPIYLNWSSAPPTVGAKIIVCLIRLVSLMVYLGVNGLQFGMFSQLNHFSEDCVAAASRPTSWATRHVETAANFCWDSTMWSILTSGINIQIEHHLFPAISSDKVVHLVPTVKEVCKEHGVVYKDFKTFFGILNSVHAYIDTLARPDPGKFAPAAAESVGN